MSTLAFPTARPAAALLVAFLAAACSSTPPPPLTSSAAEPTSVFSQTSPQGGAAPVLYSRDGSVVAAGDGALVERQDRPAPMRRDLTPGDDGRMYLLELYQNVIEERDGLLQEVTSLQADRTQARIDQARVEARAAELEARVQELEAQNGMLVTENRDLAGRLATAQIRRLQAEKVLLENRIAALRSEPVEVAEVEKP